jgi:sugar phosphate isomerase/epimerase
MEQLSLAERFDKIAKAGYDGIEARIPPPEYVAA